MFFMVFFGFRKCLFLESGRRALHENCPYLGFFWPYFPGFGLNTERYGVSLRIQSEYGKMRTRKTSEMKRNVFVNPY